MSQENIISGANDRMKNIVLFSTQPVLAAGLDVTVKNAGIGSVGATCTSIAEVRAAAAAFASELIVIDLTPEVTTGCIREICDACSNTAVIIWFDRISTEFAAQAIDAGVRGLLRKTMPVETLVKCFSDVAAGVLSIDTKV